MAKISKILYIITQSEWGGAGRYVFDLATNLPKDKYEVMVAAGGQEELFAKLNRAGVATHPLKHLVREIDPLNDLRAYWEIKKLVKSWQPDIIHLNSSKAGVIGALAGRAGGAKKIIYAAHGFVFNEPLPSWKKKLYIFLEKFTAKYKNAILCVSEFDRQTGLKYKIAPVDKLITVYNGIAPIDFLNRQTARVKLGLPASGFIVGTIANFYATKGLDFLIAAAAEVIKSNPDAIFQLIGFGAMEDRLRAEVKTFGLEKNFFIFTGTKLSGDGKIYLKAFDAFALSSVKEGLPYTIIEAMQAGLPIAATNVGGIPELIRNGENGLLVPAKDAKALAVAIISLMENQALAQKFGQQAESDAKNNFSLPPMIEKIMKYYQQ